MDWLAQVIASSAAAEDADAPDPLRLHALDGLHQHISALTGACARTLLVVQHPLHGTLTRELARTPADDTRLQPLCAAMLQVDGRDFKPLCAAHAAHAASGALTPHDDLPPCPAATQAFLTAAAATPSPHLHVVTLAGRLLPLHLREDAHLAAQLHAHPERAEELRHAAPPLHADEDTLRHLLHHTAHHAVHLLRDRGLFQEPTPPLDHLAEALQARDRAAAAQTQLSLQRHYLASLVHDLRAPLTALLGYAELLQMGVHGPTTDPQRHALSLMISRTHGALGLVGSILDYARATERKTRIRLDTFPLRNPIDRALTAVQLEAERKNLRLDAHLLEPTPALTIRCSEMRLEQILTNLLSNAVKYTDHGAVTLTASCPSPTTFQIDVTDSGIGIPDADQERIFLPYHRTRASLSRAGTGLGLAVSRAIVEAMGGRLTLQSHLGHGSTFSILLPVHTQPIA